MAIGVLAVALPASAVVVELNDLPRAHRAVVADFNGDGRSDLAVLSDTGVLRVLRGTGPFTFEVVNTFTLGVNGADLAATDTDADGDIDLGVALGDQAKLWYIRNYVQRFNIASPYPMPVMYSPISVTASNNTGDGYNEFSCVTTRPNLSVGAFSMVGHGGVGNHALSTKPDHVEAAHLDADAGTDLVITCPANDVILTVFFTEYYGVIFSMPFPDATWTALSDFDGDGDTDIAVTSKPNGRVALLANQATGTFEPPVDIGAGDSPTVVEAFDAEGDGDDDLAVLFEGERAVGILRNDGTGRFDRIEHGCSLPGVPTGMVVADLDDDGVAEAIVTLPDLGRVTIRSLDGRTAFDLSDDPVPVQPRPGGSHTPLPMAELVRVAATTSSADGAKLVLELAESAPTRVTIYSAAGRRVRELDAGNLTAGRHELAWDGRDAGGRIASPGIYFVRAAVYGESAVARVVWLGPRR